MMARSALFAFPLVLLPTLVACSAADPSATPSDATEGERLGTTSASVIKGTASDASQDAVVLIIHYDPKDTAGIGACTGTLIAPKLVLTARHCVADTDEAAACDAQGEPLAGGAVRGNHPAKSLYIFTGAKRPDFSGGRVDPASNGAQILDDGSKNLCNHDVALIVLETPITDMPIAPVRLDGDVQVGEVVTSVGWGVTEKTDSPTVRQQRTGVEVIEVGPFESRTTGDVPPNEFEVGESICSGDSGGPALAESGAVIGVVSRGGNARSNPNASDPAANCIGGTNLYGRVSAFKDLLLQGYEAAEAEPWYENGPDPRLLTPGSECTDASECRSNLCLKDNDLGGTTCAQSCDNGCAEGQVCNVEGGNKICRDSNSKNIVTSTTKSGCTTAPIGTSSGGGVALALGLGAVLGLSVSRRRRAAR